jgi:butyrate kinase
MPLWRLGRAQRGYHNGVHAPQRTGDGHPLRHDRPGALLWPGAHTDEHLDRVLHTESGLLGLAGTANMKTILARAAAGDATVGACR